MIVFFSQAQQLLNKPSVKLKLNSNELTREHGITLHTLSLVTSCVGLGEEEEKEDGRRRRRRIEEEEEEPQTTYLMPFPANILHASESASQRQQ